MKQKLRQKIIALRKGVNLDEKKALDDQILDNLEKNVVFRKAKKVAIYVSKGDEVETKNLIKKYLIKKEIFVPRVNKNKNCLDLIKLRQMEDLKKGSFGVLEPTSNEFCHSEKIDLFIVPGVAFDKIGNRLGYGGGYFDKLLKKVKTPKIGLAYSFQVVDKIKTEEHDIPVEKIVTEKGVINCC